MSDLRKHYKGGRYRKLFEAVTSTEPFDVRIEVMLFEALHSDDRRRVFVSAPRSHFEERFTVHDPGGKGGVPVVVYVSLTYGAIWCRPREEFEGTVVFDGTEVPRFEPVRA